MAEYGHPIAKTPGRKICERKMISASTFSNAFNLRKKLTEAEIILWDRLKNRQVEGVRFRRQHPILGYVVDNFANELALSIEIDGSYHNERSQKFYDDDRTEVLASRGVTIIRFTNSEVIFSTDDVIEKIRIKIIELRSSRKKKKTKST
jgi:very-short-patch-repair endonuclease